MVSAVHLEILITIHTAAASGLIKENDICCNGFSGIEVREHAKLSIVGNKIHRNAGAGVYIHDFGCFLFLAVGLLTSGRRSFAAGK